MNVVKYMFSLDVRSEQSQVYIPVTQRDTAVTLLISLTDGVTPYVITEGCLALLSITKPSGSSLDTYLQIEDNRMIYEFVDFPTSASEVGLHECQITLYDADEEILTTARFCIDVNEKLRTDGNIDISEDEKTFLDQINLAESARMKAETGRTIEESTRRTAETSRATAEAERAEAETSRATAEAERAEAESKRVEAEKAREVEFAKALDSLKYATPIVTEITLLASDWVEESGSLHSQIVSIDGVTEFSKVDLQPSIEQLAIFHEKDITFVTENEDGVVTVFVIGVKPTIDYTIQATITEVII